MRPPRPKALLASPELAIHECLIHCQPGGQPGKERNQRFPVDSPEVK